MSDEHAPTDYALLGEALDALGAGVLPGEFALEELVHLLELMPRAVRECQKRRAVRYSRALLDFGDYPSVRTAARRVAREFKFKISAETVRHWLWTSPEYTQNSSDDAP